MSKIHNIPSVTDDVIANTRRAANEVRATWMALFYLEAKKEGIDLEPIMRRAIYKAGLLSGEKERQLFPDGVLRADVYAQTFMSRSAPNTFEKELIESNSLYARVDFHYCSLVSAWQKLGLDDETCALLCDIAMEGDRGTCKALGLDFELGGTIAKGDKTCNLCFKTQQGANAQVCVNNYEESTIK